MQIRFYVYQLQFISANHSIWDNYVSLLTFAYGITKQRFLVSLVDGPRNPVRPPCKIQPMFIMKWYPSNLGSKITKYLINYFTRAGSMKFLPLLRGHNKRLISNRYRKGTRTILGLTDGHEDRIPRRIETYTIFSDIRSISLRTYSM